MRRSEADQILADWVAAVDESLDSDLRTVSNALFLEETFGISLTDAEIDVAHIGTLAGMRSVLARHRGWH